LEPEFEFVFSQNRRGTGRHHPFDRFILSKGEGLKTSRSLSAESALSKAEGPGQSLLERAIEGRLAEELS
jgi:hypothetical protein